MPEIPLTSTTPAIPVVPSHWTFPADPASVMRARRAVTAALPPGCRAELTDDLGLLTSELVTNAVRYGPRPADDHLVDLVLWPADGHYWLAVSDAGTRDLPALAAPDLEACGGRGLLLVDALSSAWAVVPRPAAGKSIVAGLRLRGPF
jgi:anti-sigma regulatory factor (Ser/Thr protein kinase)